MSGECFKGHCYSHVTAIFSLDLAKDQTGYSILRVDEDSVSFIQWGRLKSDIRNTKNMFLVGQGIADFIKETIKDLHGKNYNVHVIIEHPWFGGTRSAQQYYLFEAALQACHAEFVNVSCPTASRLKSFIASQLDDRQAYLKVHYAAIQAVGKKIPKLNKKHGYPLLKSAIKEIYAEYTFPSNQESCPKPQDIANDDSLDAIYLALFGAYFCMALPDLKTPFDLQQKKSLYWNPQAFYQDRVSPVYVNLKWKKTGLDAMWKLLKSTKWNSHGAKEQYLFNQHWLASCTHEWFKIYDSEGSKKIEKSWTCKGSKRDHLGTLTTNMKGEYFFLTPMRILTEKLPIS